MTAAKNFKIKGLDRIRFGVEKLENALRTLQMIGA